MANTSVRLKAGLGVIVALAVLAAGMAIGGLERGLVFWYTAIAGAIALGVMALWSRGARYAFGGLVLGAVLGGGLAAALTWNTVSNTGWEDLVRAIAIASGVALGSVLGALAGWLWSLGRRAG